MQSILHSGAFVIGYPGIDQGKEADYLGVETGYHVDKLQKIGLTTTKSAFVNAPVINEIKLSLECQVVHSVTVGSHTQITGEIKNILASTDVIDDNGRVILEKLDPMIYNEEAFVYHRLGARVLDAFKTGAAMKKNME